MKTVRKVKRLEFNWRQTNDGMTSGEDYDSFEVGESGVEEIIEQIPTNEGMFWNYLIIRENAEVIRVFRPNYVVYEKEIT